ncbi:hypothetical protein AAFP35_24295 [Gordonia sp. CPCC 206044]|uniref:hypothetical protein n=1 Tax=Gordonia sp. CPCC 206044 TaxID=3140793 RepID=UPI003AF389B8
MLLRPLSDRIGWDLPSAGHPVRAGQVTVGAESTHVAGGAAEQVGGVCGAEVTLG